MAEQERERTYQGPPISDLILIPLLFAVAIVIATISYLKDRVSGDV